ncbi:MarR family transcriptional regulator [Actinocatenispora sera]|uniref:MarR family winged helix-turn-helix transcriptional regulator n=1 Tax=Actinocatenispora sera TaxID=390989 RepID=UPI0033D02EEA
MTGETDVVTGDELIGRILADGQRLQQAATRLRPSPLLDLNLTMQQLKVLIALARGATSGQALTDVLGVRLATVTGIVDRLAAQHLVSRREDPNDRRVRRVELTATGRRLLDRLNEAGEFATRRLLERLDTDGLRTVAAAVRLLCEAAEDEATDRGPAGEARPGKDPAGTAAHDSAGSDSAGSDSAGSDSTGTAGNDSTGSQSAGSQSAGSAAGG